DVRCAAQYLAQRRGDLRGVQEAARDLVEQRREQVVVATIHEEHVDRLVSQRFCTLQPTEATAHDDDPGMRPHGPNLTTGDVLYTCGPADGQRRAPAGNGLTRGCVASISRIEVGEASR